MYYTSEVLGELGSQVLGFGIKLLTGGGRRKVTQTEQFSE